MDLHDLRDVESDHEDDRVCLEVSPIPLSRIERREDISTRQLPVELSVHGRHGRHAIDGVERLQ